MTEDALRLDILLYFHVQREIASKPSRSSTPLMPRATITIPVPDDGDDIFGWEITHA